MHPLVQGSQRSNSKITYQVFSLSVPASPTFTGMPEVGIYAISNTEIVVAAEVTNVDATSGPMGQYKLTALAPDPASETITPNPADPNVNMTIGNLSPGTSYSLSFTNLVTLCGVPAESPETVVTNVCTS